MTECERLVANGTFGPDFFKPEIRSDFLVEEKRKKIWAVEIDLMLQFDKVCKKHGLNYFLICGSLLGAIRHCGFVPWDDDVDVAMPRDDYDKFLKLGHEFEAPYFLQTPQTDPGFYYSFSRLRNSNTIYLSEVFRYQKINHGIPLDIFPVDDLIAGPDAEDRFNKIEDLILANSTYMRLSHPNLDEKNRERVRNYPGGDPMERWYVIQSESSRDNKKPEAKNVWFPLGCAYGYKGSFWPREASAHVVMHDFEGFKFPVPVDSDTVLSRIYGDYMKLPPKEKRYPWYGAEYFDADIPYLNYLSGSTPTPSPYTYTSPSPYA